MERLHVNIRSFMTTTLFLWIINGKLQELHKTVKMDCVLDFETTAGDMGHKTYKRSMSLLLVKAIYDVAHHEKIKRCVSTIP